MISFLNLDTFKNCRLITYKDSRRDLAKYFHMSSLLQGFLCQLIGLRFISIFYFVFTSYLKPKSCRTRVFC